MSATPADLFASLDRLGIKHTTVSHPPLFTVEESRTLRGHPYLSRSVLGKISEFFPAF
jgi:hypothetical protein